MSGPEGAHPVLDALDRLSNFLYTHEYVGDTDIDAAQEALATVREALEWHRIELQNAQGERDAYWGLHEVASEWEKRAESAEAEVERLRRHPDAWSQEAFDQQKARAEALEAEVRQLREERDVWVASHIDKDKELWMDADEIGKLERSIQYERDQVRRLTEGLRPFAKQPCGKFSPSWDGPEFVPCGECKTCIARALLSASPLDGGGA